MEYQKRARDLLDSIERELKSQSLWEEAPPTLEALSSTNPFCYDTLEIHQWLQWVLLPRIRALLDGGRPLPTECDIASYAEVVYENADEEKLKLIAAIRAFDRFCTGANSG